MLPALNSRLLHCLAALSLTWELIFVDDGSRDSNEEAALEDSIDRLIPFLAGGCPWSRAVVIVDNGSTDRTPEVARRLCERRRGTMGSRLLAPSPSRRGVKR